MAYFIDKLASRIPPIENQGTLLYLCVVVNPLPILEITAVIHDIVDLTPNTMDDAAPDFDFAGIVGFNGGLLNVPMVPVHLNPFNFGAV